jgi:putative transposase
VADNILNRDFSPDGLDQVWVSDITYVRTDEGFLYFAVVVDLFSRRIVGWSMNKNIDRYLIIRALMAAVLKRQPEEKVLVHSDQGSQYGSADYLAFLKANNLRPLMSRRGNCHDNAVAESFFATFKKRVIKKKIYTTREEAKAEYLILLRCFTIQSSGIPIIMGCRLYSSRRTIFHS